jgi:predicted nucleic acid-binding protein
MEEELPGDASTLIYLAKADAFELAEKCVRTILVPPSVWREAVSEGERIGALEVPCIRAAAEAGSLRLVELSEREETLAATIARIDRLGSGESEVLALASRIGRAVVDEGRAARVAEARGIIVVSTLFLPVLGRRSGDLDEEQAVDLLRMLATVIGPRAGVVYAIEQQLRMEEP